MWASSSLPFAEASFADGGSLPADPSIDIVLGVGSRSTPADTVPPSPRNWKVKLAYGAPFAPGNGVNTSRPAPMSAARTRSPTFNETALLLSVPAVGRLAIRTARKLFAGVSPASAKPKSATVKTYGVSSSVATVRSAPWGASLIDVTLSVTVSVSLCAPPTPVLPWSVVATVSTTGAVPPGAVVKPTLEPARKALMLPTVPVSVSAPVPEPPTATPPPDVAARVPDGTDSVTSIALAPASTSAIAIPVIALAMSSVTVIEAGTAFAGASFTGFTVMATASTRCNPPLSVDVIVSVSAPL